MNDIRFFENGLGVMVTPTRGEGSLPIRKDGVIDLSEGFEPQGFYLAILVPVDSPTIVVRRDNIGGAYQDFEDVEVAEIEGSWFRFYFTKAPVVVERRGRNVWTAWKKEHPNRVDCWTLASDDSLELFQIGVVTHDNGATFRAAGKAAWRGKLFSVESGKLVALPEDPVWGEMIEVRKRIYDHPEFQGLLAKATLESWSGRDEDLCPAVLPPPYQGFARVLWHNVFMGQSGMARALLFSGEEAWIHGSDIVDSPDEDGLKCLCRGDLVLYEGEPEPWGNSLLLREVMRTD